MYHVFLPCEVCRKHFEIEVQKLRNFDSRDEALREVLRLHNSVRVRLQKPPLKENDIIDHFFFFFFFFFTVSTLKTKDFHYLFLSLQLCFYYCSYRDCPK